MSLTLLPLPERKRFKADTRALRNAMEETTRKLRMEVRATAREPRHFKERQRYIQQGGE